MNEDFIHPTPQFDIPQIDKSLYNEILTVLLKGQK